MEISKRSQIQKLCLIASLFLITPLIPTLFRSTYLYLIFNLLVVSLCAEAGLASFFSGSEEKKQVNNMVTNSPKILSNHTITHESKKILQLKMMVEKCSSEKIMVETIRVVSKAKKCPSTPSIFFIGNGESDLEEESMIEKNEEKNEVVEGQELFIKAELFIGDFYKQLKMQRQNSWNRIHGFYQKAL